jgi:transposase-like protein
MAKHRTHSIEFKRQIAQEFLAGETLHGLAKRHDICRNLIRVWVQSTKPATLTKTRSLPICSSNTKPGSRRWNGLSVNRRSSLSF